MAASTDGLVGVFPHRCTATNWPSGEIATRGRSMFSMSFVGGSPSTEILQALAPVLGLVAVNATHLPSREQSILVFCLATTEPTLVSCNGLPPSASTRHRSEVAPVRAT